MGSLALFTVLGPLLSPLAYGWAPLSRPFAILWVAVTTGVSACASVFLFFSFFFSRAPVVIRMPFLSCSADTPCWGLWVDPLCATFLMIVGVISAIVHLYTFGYMRRDPGLFRFLAYLSLLTASMMVLVSGPHMVQMFFGWEGLGIFCYLLIGFWNKKEKAVQASLKVFIVQRLSAVALLVAIGIAFAQAGSFDWVTLLQPASFSGEVSLGGFLKVPALDFFLSACLLAAMVKSAQLGLHMGFAEAMEGPTPLSVFIHAVTLVPAGVFLLLRLVPLLEQAPTFKMALMGIGLGTALFFSLAACLENDIKKLLAYSTCGQVGLIFCALGLGAYPVALFSLLTHSFLKALLFLSAGSIIYALSGVQDLREMGGLWKYIPASYTAFALGALALVGAPYLSGYYSNQFLAGAFSQSPTVFAGALIVFFLTALYTTRLLVRVFYGRYRGSEAIFGRLCEVPWMMLSPLFLLCLTTLFLGWLLEDFFAHRDLFGVGVRLETSSSLPILLPLVTLMAAGAFFLGEGLIQRFPAYERCFLWRRVSWLLQDGVDCLCESLFVQPYQRLARWIAVSGDQQGLEGWEARACGTLCLGLGKNLLKRQVKGFSPYVLVLILAGLLAITLL